MNRVTKFPFYFQSESKDCGPTCLKIIAKFYGKILTLQQLRTLTETQREGSSLLGLSSAAEQIGFRTLGAKLNVLDLKEAVLPCLLHWNKNHYVVLYKVKKDFYYISDPSFGLLRYSKEEVLKHWIGNNADDSTEEGVTLLLEPTPKFYQSEFDKDDKKNYRFSIIF